MSNDKKTPHHWTHHKSTSELLSIMLSEHRVQIDTFNALEAVREACPRGDYDVPPILSERHRNAVRRCQEAKQAILARAPAHAG